jgi:succinoglycan biosynthesis protein ExoL
VRIAYLVHDINDPAVARRIQMLTDGGAEVALLGFSRGAVTSLEAHQPVVLGYTADGRMLQRTVAVGRAALKMPRWQSVLADADVIVARQLETLILAASARKLTGSRAPLIYECLDIHRLMLAPGVVGRLLRALEAGLLRNCDALMVSSPRFVEEYFAPTHRNLPRIELVENKVLIADLAECGGVPAHRLAAGGGPPPGPPWRIGWYGMIRCQRSLRLLADLVRRMPGQVEVTMRGRVARDVMPDFDAVVTATPGLSFDGPYDRSRDLPELYAAPHFFWAMNFFDPGPISDWLLPNRLYEGGLFGAVPLALRTAETGRWLDRYHAGILLDEELEASLPAFFAGLDRDRFDAARRAMAAIPVGAFLHDQADCASLTSRLLFGGGKQQEDVLF